jgi:hypothetical protein
MTREDVILQLYRSVRDALNKAKYTTREGNKITYYESGKKVTVSFRIKIEAAPTVLEEYAL